MVISRVVGKLKRLWFAWVWAPTFGACGKHAFLYPAFRIDGAKNVHLGDASVFQKGAWLYCVPPEGGAARLAIGSGCVFGYNNHITAIEEVVIEDDVLTANNVYISDNLHSFEDIHTPIMHQPLRRKGPVVIGRGAWLGENVCIVGASVGRNSVVGANAVVTRDIPDYCVAVGSPARVIKRFDPATGAWIGASIPGQSDE